MWTASIGAASCAKLKRVSARRSARSSPLTAGPVMSGSLIHVVLPLPRPFFFNVWASEKQSKQREETKTKSKHSHQTGIRFSVFLELFVVIAVKMKWNLEGAVPLTHTYCDLWRHVALAGRVDCHRRDSGGGNRTGRTAGAIRCNFSLQKVLAPAISLQGGHADPGLISPAASSGSTSPAIFPPLPTSQPRSRRAHTPSVFISLTPVPSVPFHLDITSRTLSRRTPAEFEADELLLSCPGPRNRTNRNLKSAIVPELIDSF